jgi:hypothetical protein
MPRYSEDLDFIAYKEQSQDKWKNTLAQAFRQMGMIGEIQSKIEAAGDHEQKKVLTILTYTNPIKLEKYTPRGINIRLEIDLIPPQHMKPETKHMWTQGTKIVQIPTLTLPSLMAGKLNAILTRKNMKGRDWFDYLWYREHG